VSPHCVQQIAFCDEHAWLADERTQHRKRLRRQGYRRAVATQARIGLVELERIELYA
jgi:hypothetical protein